MDGMAFIINTKSNTVITAMNQSGAEENIYTNDAFLDMVENHKMLINMK